MAYKAVITVWMLKHTDYAMDCLLLMLFFVLCQRKTQNEKANTVQFDFRTKTPKKN